MIVGNINKTGLEIIFKNVVDKIKIFELCENLKEKDILLSLSIST